MKEAIASLIVGTLAHKLIHPTRFYIMHRYVVQSTSDPSREEQKLNNL